MASYLLQSGTNLYTLTQGGVATQITLPSGVTLYGPSQPVRAVVFVTGDGQNPIIIVINGGTSDFIIDKSATSYLLSIAAPASAPTLSLGNLATTSFTPNRPAGDFPASGAYIAGCTYKRKDVNGTTLAESTLGPVSASFTASANVSLLATAIPTSSDASVNSRGVYRSLAGGNVMYPWFDLDSNITTSADRYGSDADLSLLPSNTDAFGTPPTLKLIATWKNRLWGVPRVNFDILQWTEDGLFFAWAATNSITVPVAHSDNYGITALIPRRDNIGIARRRSFSMISGDSNDSFQRQGISESIGCVSQESVVVTQNVAYFLGEQGVYEWSDLGIRPISDQQVKPWFSSDLYFNRSNFQNAQGRLNADTGAYELLLSSLGSTILDRWVAYDIQARCWYGPHKTNAFTPSCAGNNSQHWGVLYNSVNLPISVFGGNDGNLYMSDAVVNDNGVAVPFVVELPFLSAGDPDDAKYFGDMTIHTRAESSGTMTVTPTVGTLEATASAPLTHDLTMDRERLARLGVGRYCQLTLSHEATTEGVRVYGVEIPFGVIGRR